jgi:hypothetical protein
MSHDEHGKYERAMYPPRREVASADFHRAKCSERGTAVCAEHGGLPAGDVAILGTLALVMYQTV